jgi:hypothetical protein
MRALEHDRVFQEGETRRITVVDDHEGEGSGGNMTLEPRVFYTVQHRVDETMGWSYAKSEDAAPDDFQKMVAGMEDLGVLEDEDTN